jgi:hypothetical protein
LFFHQVSCWCQTATAGDLHTASVRLLEQALVLVVEFDDDHRDKDVTASGHFAEFNLGILLNNLNVGV